MQKIEEILQDLPNQADYQNLTSDDYTAWKDNPITKLFLADMYIHTLQAADAIGGVTIDQMALGSARYVGMRETMELIADWKPEYISEEGAK